MASRRTFRSRGQRGTRLQARRSRAARAGIVSVAALALGVGAAAAPAIAAGPAATHGARTVTTGLAMTATSGQPTRAAVLRALRSAAGHDSTPSGVVPGGWGKGHQTGEINDPAGSQYDDFTYGMAMSGNGKTAVVGAYGTATYGGAVYIFTRSGGHWTQTAAISNPGSGGAEFGVSVAMSRNGQQIAVAAVGEDLSGGLVYVYTNEGGTWTQQAQLTASDEAANWDMGQWLVMSPNGSTIVAGAPGASSQVGAAYVFSDQGGTWAQTAKLTASDGVSGDNFGYPVAISGNGQRIAVGAAYKSSYAGATYVYDLSGGTWSQTSELTAPGSGTQFYGYSLALSRRGSTLVIGSPYANDYSGAVYVMTEHAGSWTQKAELTADGAGELGFSVALALGSPTVVAGASGTASATGSAYVFGGKHHGYRLRTELTATDGAASDGFGSRVAISAQGTEAFVGAYGHANYQGAGYFFAG